MELQVVGLCRQDIRWEAMIFRVHCEKGGKDRKVPISDSLLGRLRAWDGERETRGPFFNALP